MWEATRTSSLHIFSAWSGMTRRHRNVLREHHRIIVLIPTMYADFTITHEYFTLQQATWVYHNICITHLGLSDAHNIINRIILYYFFIVISNVHSTLPSEQLNMTSCGVFDSDFELASSTIITISYGQFSFLKQFDVCGLNVILKKTTLGSNTSMQASTPPERLILLNTC